MLLFLGGLRGFWHFLVILAAIVIGIGCAVVGNFVGAVISFGIGLIGIIGPVQAYFQFKREEEGKQGGHKND